LLWAHGISGDWPILLATIDSADGLPTLRQLLAAHRYWHRRGMMVDLVVVNTKPSTYIEDLGDRITAAVYALSDPGAMDRSGGVFIRRRDLLGAEGLLMLRATARVHVPCDGRALARVLSSATAPVPAEPGVDHREAANAPARAPERSD